MKKNLIALNIGLLCLAGLLGQEIKSHWIQYWAAHNLALLHAGSDSKPMLQASGGNPAQVPNYSIIVDQNLFSKDRNNQVIEPPAAPPPKPLGPKPLLAGTLAVGETQYALMIPGEAKQGLEYQSLKIGDTIGDYKLAKILDQKVMMMANGTEVEIRLNEPSKMVARDYTPNQPSGEKVATVSTVGPATQAAPASQPPPGLNANGKKKRYIPSPFGMLESEE